MSDSMSWDGVAERIDALRTAYLLGPAKHVFGALGHEFGRTPTLSQQDLSEIESQLGVTLPEQYRTYLLQVASGGAGPGYGAFALRRNPSGQWAWEGDGAELTNLNLLPAAFAPGNVAALLAQLDSRAPSIDDEPAYERWLDERDDLLWDPARTHGSICISHEGCASRDWLVVSGPARGQVWNDRRVDDIDLAPSIRQGGVHSFVTWFHDWLTEAERIATEACV